MEVTFRASLQSAVDGETGSVTVAADDQQWSGSEDVQLTEGENFAEVKVHSFVLSTIQHALNLLSELWHAMKIL